MSKKFRIASILMVVLCLCASGFIGYHGGHAIGLYAGQIEGYTQGYLDATNRAANAPTPASETLYTSIEDSIARRQANQSNIILPLDVCAFESEYGDFELKQLQWWTGYDDFRSFFESFGIVIAEESGLAGWFTCELPEGWSVHYDDTPNRSRDESVYYLMPDGTEAFQIISHKNMTELITTVSPNLDLFPLSN